MPAQRGNVLIGPSPCFPPQAVDHRRLKKALELEIVHEVLGVLGRGVAGTALALAEEDLLSAELRRGWPCPDRAFRARRASGAGGNSQHLLERLGHDVDLMARARRTFMPFFAAITSRHPVEIGAPLLEFGEILDGLSAQAASQTAAE